MADLYVDTDGGGSATAPYDTWAKAVSDWQTAFTAASAGDNIFIQGAAADTAATARTMTLPSTLTSPVKVYGVKDGTTNEPPVVSDLCIRGTDTLPLFQVTGAGNDLTITGGASALLFGIECDAADQIIISSSTGTRLYFIGSRLKFVGRIRPQSGKFYLIDCDTAFNSASALLQPQGNMFISGGEFTFNGTVDRIFDVNPSYNNMKLELRGVDLSSWAAGNVLFYSSSTSNGFVRFINLNLPATYTLFDGDFTGNPKLEAIGCDTGSSRAAGTSILNYSAADLFGTIESEETVVRTGGADDGASGAFSYALTPRVDSTLESTHAALRSPWLNVWLTAGANTLTAYIANDSASTDFNEDEVWLEVYTPDAGDTAQHDLNFDPALARLLSSATAITDDTGSTWGTGGNNHQKLSVTVTTGFEGWAYARLHFAKRYAASPVTLYLDPKIAVT